MTDARDTVAGIVHAMDTVDDVVDEWWERLRGNQALDRLFYTASEAADFSMLWHTAGVVQALVRDDPRVAVALSSALAVESALVNGPVKSLFRRNRPVHEGPRPHSLRTPRTSSFPSGHASAAMVAAALLSQGPGGRAWYVPAGVVAASRIHVRIHHASDVVGGVALGAVLAAVARRAISRVVLS